MSEITTQVSSSVNALMQELDIITHNLANSSTVGYKRRCNAFSKSLEAQQGGVDPQTPAGIDLRTMFDFSQGNVIETGRPLDFAVCGKGFFVIETPQGPLYTRNGMFQTNQNGQVVDSQGRGVAGQSGPITIPNDIGLSQVNVANDGSVSAGGAVIGKFRIVDFGDNEKNLLPAGLNCFRMTDENIRPVDAEHTVVKQGYQESSNVRMVDELVGMITVSRLYEANMKFVSAQKEASSSLMSVAMG